MYTSLLLDLDNTLLDFNAAEAHAVRKVLKSRRFLRGALKPFLKNLVFRAIPRKFPRITALIYPRDILRWRVPMKFSPT